MRDLAYPSNHGNIFEGETNAIYGKTVKRIISALAAAGGLPAAEAGPAMKPWRVDVVGGVLPADRTGVSSHTLTTKFPECYVLPRRWTQNP
jgi:hypothetical protein